MGPVLLSLNASDHRHKRPVTRPRKSEQVLDFKRILL
jgi:hypothetical protein